MRRPRPKNTCLVSDIITGSQHVFPFLGNIIQSSFVIFQWLFDKFAEQLPEWGFHGNVAVQEGPEVSSIEKNAFFLSPYTIE